MPSALLVLFWVARPGFWDSFGGLWRELRFPSAINLAYAVLQSIPPWLGGREPPFLSCRQPFFELGPAPLAPVGPNGDG